ncbi:myosin-binding protein 7-like [Phragmites australis]|uniref:myosin-binding protein 7-like n=1 Tax=Phragmites australis TaxID=29695 RepID=UPI002D774A9E|nr:myosin-binding protein 7-like [Phragmites australis]
MADADDPPPPLCPLCGQPTASASPQQSAAANASPARPPLKRRPPPEAPPAVVRVEIGDEAVALRDALARQQAALGDLQAELDAERGAAAGAASEAMTMILRLQREKAEAMMEARQFRRYAEEKMSHDAAELSALEEALAKREAALRALQQTPRHPSAAAASGASTPRPTCVTPRPPASPSPSASASGGYYPALRCCIDHPRTASEADALDAQTPRDQLTRLAHRVHLLERGAGAPLTATTTTPIIRVAPGSAFPLHARAYSDDSLDFCDGEYFPDDDCGASDRVYTVDAIHGGGSAPLAMPEGSCCGGTPMGSDCCGGSPWAEDEEVRRLSARMQALEADRESMRQAIISMSAEKAQVVLLKEIAQKLCREAAAPPLPAVPMAQQHFYKGGNAAPAMTVTVRPPRHPPVLMQRRVVKRTSFFAVVVKWVTSIIWWRRKSSRIKYPIGQSGNNVGLLLLLDKAPRAGHGHQRPPKKI